MAIEDTVVLRGELVRDEDDGMLVRVLDQVAVEWHDGENSNRVFWSPGRLMLTLDHPEGRPACPSEIVAAVEHLSEWTNSEMRSHE